MRLRNNKGELYGIDGRLDTYWARIDAARDIADYLTLDLPEPSGVPGIDEARIKHLRNKVRLLQSLIFFLAEDYEELEKAIRQNFDELIEMEVAAAMRERELTESQDPNGSVPAGGGRKGRRKSQLEVVR